VRWGGGFGVFSLRRRPFCSGHSTEEAETQLTPPPPAPCRKVGLASLPLESRVLYTCRSWRTFLHIVSSMHRVEVGVGTRASVLHPSRSTPPARARCLCREAAVCLCAGVEWRLCFYSWCGMVAAADKKVDDVSNREGYEALEQIEPRNLLVIWRPAHAGRKRPRRPGTMRDLCADSFNAPAWVHA